MHQLCDISFSHSWFSAVLLITRLLDECVVNYAHLYSDSIPIWALKFLIDYCNSIPLLSPNVIILTRL